MRKLLLLSLLLITSCTDSTIPNVSFKLDNDKLVKLTSLNSVQLIRNPDLFTIKCRTFEAGQTGYYLMSDNTKLTSDYAKWKCALELKYLNCPDFTAKADNGSVSVIVNRGDVTEYSQSDMERCVNYAIEHAPTELKPTSEEVRNRDSWSK